MHELEPPQLTPRGVQLLRLASMSKWHQNSLDEIIAQHCQVMQTINIGRALRKRQPEAVGILGKGNSDKVAACNMSDQRKAKICCDKQLLQERKKVVMTRKI